MANDKNLTPIPPLFFNPNAPSLYGLGLTDYEILTKIAFKINECVEGVNNFSELYQEIKELVSQLNENIQNEVKNELEEMLNEGTLAEIVQEWLTSNLIAKSENLTTRRLWRKINATGVNDIRNTSELYSVNQGACVFKDPIDQKTKFAIYFGKVSRATEGVENGCFAIFSTSSQNPETIKVLPCGHGQSVCYFKEKFYIAHSSDNETTPSTSITVFNPLNSTYVTKKFTGHQPYQVFENGENLFFYDLSDKSIYKITDFSNAECEFMYGMTDLTSDGVNGCCINNNGYLVFADKELLKFFDFQTGKLIWCYNVKNISDDSFSVGEVQSVSRYSGNTMALFSWISVGGTSGIAQRSLSQVFIFNPVSNKIQTELTVGEKSGSNHLTLYVSGDKTQSFDDVTNAGITNPNGGSSDTAFNTIQEALDFFINTHQKSVEIRMIGTSDLTYSIWSGVNGFLRNYNAGQSLLVGGVYVENGGSCRIQGASESERLTIVQSNTSAVGSFSSGVAPLDALGATIQLVKNLYINPVSSNYNSCNYGIRVNQSILLSSNPSSQDITIYQGTTGTKVYIGNSLSNKTNDDF